MKWFILIVTLIVGGVVLYYVYRGSKPKPGTPDATAEAYVKAANNGDEATIRSLCTAAAVQDALRLAPEVRQMTQGQVARLQVMKADPPRRGLCVMARGRLLGIQLIQENGRWKIVEIGLSAM
ncbi:hypothetical protein AMJ85_09500 [candidate division BRC1 bacterium SM23_51]|nr:MAG: hypothetical protein AMJ85_09500 [candidate division BRC1 bacterium SM23_51]